MALDSVVDGAGGDADRLAISVALVDCVGESSGRLAHFEHCLTLLSLVCS